MKVNKSAIKNFAVRARNRLIEDITQKAYELGLTKDEIKGIETFEGGFKIKGLDNSKTYKKYEVKQREKLVSNIREKGFEQVIEEVAYTWFNRFIALRFMEVNEYLPTGVRVLSSIEEGKTEPDIIKEVLNVDLDIDKEIVYKLIDKNDTEDLYKYLIIKQCNQLGQIMPMVFEEISDYTELLLPENLLAEGSVIRDLVESIEEDDYKDQVEIIGWMYQYYISEKKEEVDNEVKQGKKVSKDKIPAKTQLFTPKWIVKYMVENSLGRLWLESHPDEELKSQWKYYLEEAEQDPDVQKKLDQLKDPNLNPENIKVLDPSMGSGHILVYAFDVLYDIYLKANYSERDIPQLILEKNLYGLDIDDRAGQLAAFALMMKARSINRRIFRRKIELNVCSIQESNGIPKEAMDYLVSPKDTEVEKFIHRDDVEYLIEVFEDAKEYGSILNVKKIDFEVIEKRIEEIKNGETVDLFEFQHREIILEKIPPILKQARIMSNEYDVVCTNPPYLQTGDLQNGLSNHLKQYFKNAKSDFYAIFIKKSLDLVKLNGYVGMITLQSWMFSSVFEMLRKDILSNNKLIQVNHLGKNTFEEINGEVVNTVSFIIQQGKNPEYKPTFIDLTNQNNTIKKEQKYLSDNIPYTNFRQNDFFGIPKVSMCYWISENVVRVFNSDKSKMQFKAGRGLQTGDDNIYLRLWHEVAIERTNIIKSTEYKWFLFNKGGKFRKWYGNNGHIVDWKQDGFKIKSDHNKGKVKSTLRNLSMFFTGALTYTYITSGKFNARYCDNRYTYSGAGAAINAENNLYLLGFLNSRVFMSCITSLKGETMRYEVGDVESVPLFYISDIVQINKIETLVKDSINLSKSDWDSFETSWDFKQHPLLIYSALKNGLESDKFKTAFTIWNDFTNEQFNQLKVNEEELNRIFIDIYGFQDELTSEVEDKDITISKANRERDIRSFISYAVGCMFGRYSLDEEGLIYAGGEFDINKYKTFIPTKDNVLVIADDDYFEDDIVNRFVDFVKITFGEKTLKENLDYIAETLGMKSTETARQTIRRYFLKDFYKDHVKTYSNRPIYWLFYSGKENGFKALIYMHRYDSSTVARVRTDYLHKLQKKYEAEVRRLDILLESELSTRDKAAAKQKKDIINKQILECLAYDQVIAHVANQKVDIDLDDGVVVNYDKFQGVQIPQGDGKKPLKANLLGKI